MYPHTHPDCYYQEMITLRFISIAAKLNECQGLLSLLFDLNIYIIKIPSSISN